MKSFISAIAAAAACTLAQATVINTQDAAAVAAFQQGLSVQTFENVAGRTPMPLTSYTGAAVDVSAGARVYDQVPGFRFSSGGAPGEVFAALFELGGTIADDAISGNTVLSPLSGDNQTQFTAGVFLEAFLPTRVSDLGFWVSPSVGAVRVIFAQEMERALRYDSTLALLMIDLDHFKDVNDLHGHATGDAVLQGFARTVSGILRASDLFGRVGGEEFAVLMPQTDRAGAMRLAQRLRKLVRDQPVPAVNGSVPYTVSVGVACLRDLRQAASVEALMMAADRALYDAKHQGRDRVVDAGNGLA